MPGPSVTHTFTNSTTADATQVNTNFTDLINGATDGTKDYSISALTCAGNATFNANVTVGNASADDFTVTASLASTINIKTTYSYDIGSSTIGLRSIYLGSSDSAARTTRVIGATVGSSWTLTLPTGVPAGNAYCLESTTGGVTSWVNRRVVPTVQKFTSSSGTYTTPAGVLYIRVRMVGGGGGGAGGGNTGSVTGGNGGSGGNTTFGSSLLVANGGTGGNGSGNAGTGGTASLGTGPIGIAITGGTGGGGYFQSAGGGFATGQTGGVSPFGGAGGGSPAGGSGGRAAVANTGSGGGGGGSDNTASAIGGSAGGAGGYVDAIITSPDATYAYAVGAAGTAGTAGTGGTAGGAGGSGIIIVEEFYQ